MASATDIFRFRSQFPEFETVDDPSISNALNTSKLWLDPNVWDAADFQQAYLLWAAHLLSLILMQTASTELGGTGETDLYVRSISFGERRVVFQERRGAKGEEVSAGPGESLLDQTIYGQMFLMLRSRNIIPVAIV